MAAFACAHRGLSAEHPENTLAAFQAAATAGFTAIELDVRTTADNEIVVLHDAGIERTTDGNGRVADMRYDDVRRHPTPEGPIPRLDDVLSSMRDWHGLWNVEVKALRATEPALQLLEHHHAAGHAQLSSMDPRVLEEARRLAPDLPRGLISLGPVDDDYLTMAKELGCKWINADHGYMDKAAVDRMHAAGFRVGAWTVNDAARARELADWGVECVITDLRMVLEGLGPRTEARPYF
ncbi:MAG TPA: glycerophosphodiester phosphodiesterase family protein [Candidatus Thermoplasmatota archaeon]|nr:glycerophosphodiester phosphodiesterase family protein [Candidatus Thermoplasmatota archaeon]